MWLKKDLKILIADLLVCVRKRKRLRFQRYQIRTFIKDKVNLINLIMKECFSTLIQLK